MSATTEAPVRTARAAGAPARVTRPREAATAGTVIAFGLLGAYGVLRWSTMLASAPVWRLAGLVALACAIAALGQPAQSRDPRVRAAANGAIVLAGLAILVTAGIPLDWIGRGRIALTSRAISDGLSTLPGVLVPYRGSDPWTRLVIMLGAGMLLLGAALTLATSVRPAREARLAGAAVPLIVLATVPSAIATPHLPWLHGVVMFALLSLFVFRERVSRSRALGAGAFVAAIALVAVAASPALGGRPWISVTTPALRTAGQERFDWSQTYGPLDWPQTGATVLTVNARLPYYWKAENLDAFDGTGWVQARVGLASGVRTIAPTSIKRWTQTLIVTLDGSFQTHQVIAAGMASAPTPVPAARPGVSPPAARPGVSPPAARPGVSPGTFVSSSPLVGGDRYEVSVYTPLPSVAELASAGTRYPLRAIAPDLTLGLPAGSGKARLQVEFAPYGASDAIVGAGRLNPARARSELQRSPYSRAWRLAQRLKRSTTNPYAYVQAVKRFLAVGYTYDQNPPAPTRYPLLQFLFDSRVGYCQQFAGAMALLLRMGGVPARVATGFTTGSFDRATDAYVVANQDAHAWVEAWFPRYGWVQIEATPGSDPALGGRVPSLVIPATTITGVRTTPTPAPTRQTADAAPARRHPRSDGSGPSPAIPVLIAVAILAVAGVGIRSRRRRQRSLAADGRLDELERAFARCGLQLGDGVTLAALEHRLADRPEAAEYVRRIRRRRFASEGPEPTAAQRRALRAALGRGGGIAGRIRALAALPPALERRS